MDYLMIINREVTVKVKQAEKSRADKKHTVKGLLTASEKRILNTAMLEQGYSTVLAFVNDAITNHLHLAITSYEIAASRRLLRESDGIQINGRLSREVYEKFRVVQADKNLNQRQLVYILIRKALEIAGYEFR